MRGEGAGYRSQVSGCRLKVCSLGVYSWEMFSFGFDIYLVLAIWLLGALGSQVSAVRHQVSGLGVSLQLAPCDLQLASNSFFLFLLL